MARDSRVIRRKKYASLQRTESLDVLCAVLPLLYQKNYLLSNNAVNHFMILSIGIVLQTASLISLKRIGDQKNAIIAQYH